MAILVGFRGAATFRSRRFKPIVKNGVGMRSQFLNLKLIYLSLVIELLSWLKPLLNQGINFSLQVLADGLRKLSGLSIFNKFLLMLNALSMFYLKLFCKF